MTNVGDVVYICKAASEENNFDLKDPYVIELKNRGFVVKIILVLDFVYKNIDFLKIKLLNPDHYSGVIFTSPRCVRAVINAVGTADNLDQKWHNLKAYVVGEATGRLVREHLGLSTEGEGAGNGKQLAPLILQSQLEKPLLLPCGNLKMDTLEDLLRQGGVATESVEVYETRPHPKLEHNLTSAVKEKTPNYVVYFSPSGVRNTYPILQRSGLDLDSIKWVSIGPTTAEAIRSLGLQVHCSAEKPTPQSLGEAITATRSS